MPTTPHCLSHAAVSSPSTIPVYRGSPGGSGTATFARILMARAAAARAAGRPERAVIFDRPARLLAECSRNPHWRCGLPVCPACECRKAKRYRERMEARLRKPGARFALVTVTLAADGLRTSAQALCRRFSALRRRRAWTRSVAGGEQHLQVLRVAEGARCWNVHLHAIVELRANAADFDRAKLDADWRGLLDARGMRGSLHIQAIGRHWSVYRDRDMARIISRPAFYVTRRKARELAELPSSELEEILCFLPRQRRVSSFGIWRRKSRRADHSRNPNPNGERA